MLLSVCACSASKTGGKGGKLTIVTTIFPEYDWVREIVGDTDRVNVTLLLDNGADLHNYQATAGDMVKIATCDMFIYVGGESDEWVNDVLKTAQNKDMIVVNLLDVLGDKVKEEEVKEGMEHDHDHDEEEEEHDHDHEHEHDHDEEEAEYDEHVWLSLKNAVDLCNHISKKIQALDPDNADAYAANTTAYVAKLRELDAKFEAAVNAASVNTLVFGDRFPFRYLVDDYGLDYYAAFVGCSAESEASFSTIAFLAGKVDELGLKAILKIENSNNGIAETIRNTTSSKDQTILTMNSLQSITSRDVKNGTTYLGVMENNLTVLKDALK